MLYTLSSLAPLYSVQSCLHFVSSLLLPVRAGNFTYNLTLIVQSWWEGREYYDYSTAYCGDDDGDDDKRDDDMEEFDECQSYTQVGGVTYR